MVAGSVVALIDILPDSAADQDPAFHMFPCVKTTVLQTAPFTTLISADRSCMSYFGTYQARLLFPLCRDGLVFVGSRLIDPLDANEWQEGQ